MTVAVGVGPHGYAPTVLVGWYHGMAKAEANGAATATPAAMIVENFIVDMCVLKLGFRRAEDGEVFVGKR